jgi:methylated-DNA-[protein]-cysteine S-methyltransferase
MGSNVSDQRTAGATALVVETIRTPIGAFRLVTAGGLLRASEFADRDSRLAVSLKRLYPVHHSGIRSGKIPPPLRRAVEAYFEGDLDALDRIGLDLPGTPFQRAVWMRLRQIPAGSTMSYMALATRIGRPSAVRAVGQANGGNPIPVVVPCHRLVGSGGSLIGYGGGLDRKRWLLAHEARYANARTRHS